MGCSKLHLEAVCCVLATRRRHHPIVDQEIERFPGTHSLCEVGDRCEIGQIEMFVTRPGAAHFAADFFDSSSALLIVAPGQNDIRACLGQDQRRLVAEAARGARHHGRSAQL